MDFWIGAASWHSTILYFSVIWNIRDHLVAVCGIVAQLSPHFWRISSGWLDAAQEGMIKCGASWHQDTSPPHKPHIYITCKTMKLKPPFSFLLPTIIRFSSLNRSTQSKKKTQFCSNQNWCSVNVQFGFPPSLCNFHKHRVIWNSQRARQSAWIEWTLATSRQPQKISRSMHNGLVHLIFVFLSKNFQPCAM